MNTSRYLKYYSMLRKACLIGCLVGVGYFVTVFLGILSKKAAPPILSDFLYGVDYTMPDGPFYEIHLDTETTKQSLKSVLPGQYKASHVRFSEHRGKWIFMMIAEVGSKSGRDTEHRVLRGNRDLPGLMPVIKQFDNAELWFLRINPVNGSKRHITGSSFSGFYKECHRDGITNCFDRFLMGSTRAGENKDWFQPQLDWLNELSAGITGLGEKYRDLDYYYMPLLLAINPEGKVLVIKTPLLKHSERFPPLSQASAVVKLLAQGAPMDTPVIFEPQFSLMEVLLK